MIALIQEYQKTLKQTRSEIRRREKLLKQPTIHNAKQLDLAFYIGKPIKLLHHDLEIFREAASGITYTLKLLKNGDGRGIERRAVYQNMIFSERNTIYMKTFDEYEFDNDNSDWKQKSIQKHVLEKALQLLTDRQREIFIHYAEGLSYEEIATLLNIKKQNVGESVKASIKKIEGNAELCDMLSQFEKKTGCKNF